MTRTREENAADLAEEEFFTAALKTSLRKTIDKNPQYLSAMRLQGNDVDYTLWCHNVGLDPACEGQLPDTPGSEDIFEAVLSQIDEERKNAP